MAQYSMQKTGYAYFSRVRGNTMSYAEVVSNTRSSIVHACRKESCRACVVFDKEMCDRKGPDVQTCQEAGFSAEQTSSVSPI